MGHDITNEVLNDLKEIEKEEEVIKEAAATIEKDLSQKYKIIKGKFKSKKIIAFGAFVAVFDSENYNLSKFNLQVALRPHFYDEFNPDDEWYIYDSKLIAYSLKVKDLNAAVTNGLRQVLKATFDNRDFIKDIIKNFNNNEFNDLNNRLREKILDVISDTALETDFFYDSVKSLEIPTGVFGEEPKEEEQKTTALYDYSAEDKDRIFIKMDIIHDPVNGTQMKDLERGMRVYAKNLVKEEIEKYNLQKTSSYKNGEYCPIFVGLRKTATTDETGEWEAVFNFGDGKYGKVMVYPIVKVKVFEEETMLIENVLKEEKTGIVDINESLKMYAIFIGILILFSIVIWWYYNYGILLTLKK
ncbi:MAG TPA: hypothetical protein PLD27_03350 [bacterium]|nr:hypothetical protein [bacterium]HOL48281.1 hypothetical protein [bacterium]HPQ18738.1 hypothetical protein [bacterium]